MLGSPILYLKGTRLWGFQLLGFYCKRKKAESTAGSAAAALPVLRILAVTLGFKV